jgi:hypothetical protein
LRNSRAEYYDVTQEITSRDTFSDFLLRSNRFNYPDNDPFNNETGLTSAYYSSFSSATRTKAKVSVL